MFWRVVSSLTPQLQRDLLRFVASCSRPPLLGFSHLVPLFGITKKALHEVADGADRGDQGPPASRLPSSGTCMNLLKLPEYGSEEELRYKLTYAISSNSGFDLS